MENIYNLHFKAEDYECVSKILAGKNIPSNAIVLSRKTKDILQHIIEYRILFFRGGANVSDSPEYINLNKTGWDVASFSAFQHILGGLNND